jgi:hypothetical protein
VHLLADNKIVGYDVNKVCKRKSVGKCSVADKQVVTLEVMRACFSVEI